MESKILTEIVHARLHRHRKQLRLPDEMTVPEFMRSNREVISGIVRYLKEEYGVSISGLERLAMGDGIRDYLAAEELL